jgi:hypothetical protein
VIYSNVGYVNTVIHPFELLPCGIFRFQMLKIKQYVLNDAGPSDLVDHRVGS